MQAAEIIRKKRDGKELTPEELKAFLQAYLDGTIADYQMSAWLMSVFFKGLSKNELEEWTRLMWQSGRTFPRAHRSDFWIDKHSTGGVGDKTSLILVPWVASVCERVLGQKRVKIPMVSGRGLGHTGGTLDKLESVPGFLTRVSFEQALDLIERNGFVMMGQTKDMAPADRLIYALRDVTGTVESLPLIVSSIMSKKLSENLDGIVFDVKVGRAAFMKTEEAARQLATALIEVAEAHSIAAVGVLTRMDEPLGYGVGHQIEVEECADFLEGNKKREEGLYRVTLRLAAWMVLLASRGTLSFEEAERECEAELKRPGPYGLFRKMFEAQGGSWDSFEKARAQRQKTLECVRYTAGQDGWVEVIEAETLARLVGALGGARVTKDSIIDFQVGAHLYKKVGDAVFKGDTIVEVYHRSHHSKPMIEKLLNDCITIGLEQPKPLDWVIGTCHGKK